MISQKRQVAFWKKCGQYKECGYCEGTTRIYSSPGVYSQCRNCDGWGYFIPRAIDLNSLFKYAVPIAIDKIMAENEYSSDLTYEILFKRWLQELALIIPEADTALFLVLEEVL